MHPDGTETDEVEYLITARSWDYLKGFLGVFASCEEDFVSLIDGMYPTERPADVSARDSMQLEAQNVFLAVDDLYQVRYEIGCIASVSGHGGSELRYNVSMLCRHPMFIGARSLCRAVEFKRRKVSVLVDQPASNS